MTLFNFLTDNNLVFCSLFAGTVGFIGYSFATSYLNSFYDLSKNRYLSYTNNYIKPNNSVNFKPLRRFNPIFVSKMPLYHGYVDSSFLSCSDIECPKLLDKNLYI